MGGSDVQNHTNTGSSLHTYTVDTADSPADGAVIFSTLAHKFTE